MNKRDLHPATQILTNHAGLNYHLSKIKRSVQPICPLSKAENDTGPTCLPHLLAPLVGTGKGKVGQATPGFRSFNPKTSDIDPLACT